jgi:hypothetical protein
MNQFEYLRECKAYEEKRALAELEVTKAAERVAELNYQYHRFQLDFAIAVAEAAGKKGT